VAAEEAKRSPRGRSRRPAPPSPTTAQHWSSAPLFVSHRRRVRERGCGSGAPPPPWLRRSRERSTPRRSIRRRQAPPSVARCIVPCLRPASPRPALPSSHRLWCGSAPARGLPEEGGREGAVSLVLRHWSSAAVSAGVCVAPPPRVL
jgi:hypothetical protein